MVTGMTCIARAAFWWNKALQEPVDVSRPLSQREFFGLTKELPPLTRVQGVRFAQDARNTKGLNFGTKDIEGLIFETKDGQIMVAVKIFRPGLRKRRADYWAYSVEDYVSRLADYEVYGVDEIRRRINYVQGQLEDLLLKALDHQTAPLLQKS